MLEDDTSIEGTDCGKIGFRVQQEPEAEKDVGGKEWWQGGQEEHT